jgi:DNA-cytosine methyltransferase
MKPIIILSCFDGMSCGQIALERAGIPVKAYYASEIDRYAIQTTQKNYPNTIQLGDINCWKEWNIPTPDLILAGSPCQGFSIAGHGLNFDDPRSKLFFVFCDILAHFYTKNPDLKFLLENVKMKKEWQEVITDRMKVEPVLLNSALVSAQNRERLYWANWTLTAPEDKHIYLKDIVEHGEVDRLKSYAIDANYYKGGSEAYLKRTYYGKSKRQVVKYQSARRLMVKNGPVRIGTDESISGHDYNKRIYSQEGKSPTLNAHHGGNLEPKVAQDDCHYRKLTPTECERLQTVPEGYTSGVSDTQRYRQLGNGWTVDMIAHFLRQL